MQCRYKLCLLQCDHHLIHDPCYWPERKGERTTYSRLSVTLMSGENCEDCIIRKLEVSENTPQTTIPTVRFEAQCRTKLSNKLFFSIIGSCQSSLYGDPLPVSVLAQLWPASSLFLPPGADGQYHKGAEEHRKQGHYCNVQVSVAVIPFMFIYCSPCRLWRYVTHDCNHKVWK